MQYSHIRKHLTKRFCLYRASTVSVATVFVFLPIHEFIWTPVIAVSLCRPHYSCLSTFQGSFKLMGQVLSIKRKSRIFERGIFHMKTVTNWEKEQMDILPLRISSLNTL